MAVVSRLPETIDTTDVVEFLRRFASMMSVGASADKFAQAALLVEDLAHDIKAVTEALEAERKARAVEVGRREVAEAESVVLENKTVELAAQLMEQEQRSSAARDAVMLEKDEQTDRADQAEADLAKVSEELQQLQTSLQSRDASAVIVPMSKLEFMRAQFQSLALEFRQKGDAASEFMCEIGSRAVDKAIAEGTAEHQATAAE